jgi:ubiquinone/menaquinone biosynthesis C-methylase UbiE
MGRQDRYIPALGLRALTPLYDPVLRQIFRDEQFKRTFIARANIQPGQRVLDLGCGTGTLMLLIKQAQPHVVVTGSDGDVEVLAIARAKAAAAGEAVSFGQALASHLPYPDGTFDRVLSSLVFHHLPPAVKRAALREAHRVLGTGGELHILDVGEPHTALGKLLAPAIRHAEQARENVDGLIPTMARAAGFVDVTVIHQETFVAVATLAHVRARKGVAA